MGFNDHDKMLKGIGLLETKEIKSLPDYHNGEDVENMRQFVIMNGLEQIRNKGCSRDQGLYDI